MKILSIIGTRPQYIKAAVVLQAVRKRGGIQHVLVDTSQHFQPEMSAKFYEELGLPPADYSLNVNSLPREEMISQMATAASEVISRENPDCIIVYGDTNSTLAGARAASSAGIPLAHVEAGLRLPDESIPEERNRREVDSLSDFLFCPGEAAVENLRAPGQTKPGAAIVKSGDVMLDAVRFYSSGAREDKPGDFAVCTLHRAENTDDPIVLGRIITALNQLSAEMRLVIPIHPRTRKALEVHGFKLECGAIQPVGYLEMLGLLGSCGLAITDSGGLQREAYYLKRPCAVLREASEWVELLQSGASQLAGTSIEGILQSTRIMRDRVSPHLFSEPFYGYGNASEVIVDYLVTRFLE